MLGERADREQYALLSARGIARQAIEIDDLVSVAGGRRAIEGRFLEAGHPVHDAYVGKPQPVAAARNPVPRRPSARPRRHRARPGPRIGPVERRQGLDQGQRVRERVFGAAHPVDGVSGCHNDTALPPPSP
ncbi:hypothetical protein AB0L42_39170 [Streptomyces sp. NPDC052287]|uniref:hypothetical protein n=1 Tax=Streptomyces sp. NPDC052287 TaxID=3154950 RepID=UPI00341515BD